MPDARLQRTRDSYLCPLCGFKTTDGEHGIYAFDEPTMTMVICRPLVLCDTPKALGVITDADGAR